MATALSLSPLFRHSVGFDQFNELFDSLAASDNNQAFPPYDIIKAGEDHYRIVMAIAGYSQADIAITLENNLLRINGQQEKQNLEKSDETFLHRGIARRAFERSFRLAEHMKVEKAELNNGLLTVHLAREIPEEKKPQMIPITSGKDDAIEQQ